ncbi:MAG: hypothetical protein QW270_00785 [Candidatus Bathyarchaeia archaeon]
MSFGQVEGFFVDVCVLLPHPTDSLTQSCSTFLKENAARCILSSSVKTEAISLIENSYNIIVSDLRSKLKPFLEKQGVKELSKRHGKLMAQFFMERRRELKKVSKSSIQRDMIGAIENYVASRLHSLKHGERIIVDNFLASLIAELTMKKHTLQAPFRGIKVVEITPDASIVSQIVLRTLITNQEDVKHLASALTYQFQRNKWVIFVTTDETEILSKESELFNTFALQCSSPAWASDYYTEMTRLKTPIEYFREINNYSLEQKEFASVIERTMGIKLMR